jgi:Protein of unknown function (DUF2851)
MKEDFLHFLWRFKKFNLHDLTTSDGEKIDIVQWGQHNTHAGPDFLNVRLYIGETLWAGNVEMHLNASEWVQHRHHEDKAYNNVVLHVVLNEDQAIFRQNGEKVPCLELKNRIPSKLHTTYLAILHNAHWIPCQHHFFEVPERTKILWLERLLIERLEQKTETIAALLAKNTNNWEETFYQVLARSFGLKVNGEPFESLAKSVSLLTLTKHKNSLLQLEALLFGQAGMLENPLEDNYPQQLQKEYQFLRAKHQLSPIPSTMWKFLRLRPSNFPTIRLAQLATLIFQSVHLFSKILEAHSIKEIHQLFELQLSDYWLTHYTFDKSSPKRSKSLGEDAINLLIINTIAPFLFLYGTQKGIEAIRDKALNWLETLAAEDNSIIGKWKELGLTPNAAAQTQALLQLKNNYCDQHRCLECAIGNAIMTASALNRL